MVYQPMAVDVIERRYVRIDQKGDLYRFTQTGGLIDTKLAVKDDSFARLSVHSKYTSNKRHKGTKQTKRALGLLQDEG